MSFHYAINLKDTDHPLSHLESTTCSLQSSTEGEAHGKAENMLGIIHFSIALRSWSSNECNNLFVKGNYSLGI